MENVVDTIVRAVHKGDSVTITGFGVFEQRRRAARVARNPRTGETVKVKPTSVPAFRPGAQFKAVVSGAQRLPAEGPAVKRGVTAGGARTAVKRAAVKKAVKRAAVKKAVKRAAVKKAVKRAAVKKAVKRNVAKKAVKRNAAKKAVKRSAAKKAVKRNAAKKAVKKAAVKKAVKRKRSQEGREARRPATRPRRAVGKFYIEHAVGHRDPRRVCVW